MTVSQNPRRAASIARLAAPALAIASLLAGCSHVPGTGGHHRPVTPTHGNRIPILSRIDTSARLDPALETVSVIVPPAEVNADWPQAGGSPSKSYGNPALAASPRLTWTAHLTGATAKTRLGAAPVIGGGQIFAIDTQATLHAWDAATGRERWRHVFETGRSLSTTAYGGGASYADGKVYATTGLGDVAALDAATGAVNWKVKPAGPLRGAPTVAYNSVYVTTIDNQIYSLNAADGTAQWNEAGASGQSGVFGVAAPAAAQGTVIAGYSTGELVAYRYENGRQLWSDALARTSLSTSVGVLTDIDADPIVDHGRVYALGQGGRMAAYELVTGQRIWELNLAGISTPAVAGDWVFALTDEAKLYCIARTTGKVRWVTQLANYENPKKKKGQLYWTGPTLAGDRLWMANSGGEIWSASVADGAAVRLTSVRAPVTLAPVVANSTLYVLDDSGKLSAFR